MVVNALNHRSRDAEAGRSLGVRDQPSLHTEFQDRQGYIERHYLKKKKVIKTNLFKGTKNNIRDWQFLFFLFIYFTFLR